MDKVLCLHTHLQVLILKEIQERCEGDEVPARVGLKISNGARLSTEKHSIDVILSQYLCSRYSKWLWKTVRTEKKEKSKTAPLTPKGSAPCSIWPASFLRCAVPTFRQRRKIYSPPAVIRFLDGAEESAVAPSVITLAELRYGVERLAQGAKRERHTRWLDEEVPRRFEGRILGIDDAAAAEWGRTMARAERAGRPMSEMDAWLAALASVHHLVLVTRNGEDFSGFAGQIHNPWS